MFMMSYVYHRGNNCVFQTFTKTRFHDFFNQNSFYYHKRYEYRKTRANYICVTFSKFFERGSLDYHEYKMSMGLYNGEKTLFQI